jgi:hypothetical protein
MNRSVPTKLIQAIAGLRNVFRGDEFVEQVFHYLTEAYVNHREEGRLYVIPDSIDVSSALFHKEVSVGFKLSRRLPLIRVLPRDLQQHESDSNTTEYYLTSGTTITGEQTLYFTFTSSESFKKNLRRFRQFINQSYISPEGIRELNRKKWNELDLAQDHLLQQTVSAAFNEENLEEIWQRARYYTYQKRQWLDTHAKGTRNVDEIIENVMAEIIRAVGRPLPGLVTFICQKIETQIGLEK